MTGKEYDNLAESLYTVVSMSHKKMEKIHDALLKKHKQIKRAHIKILGSIYRTGRKKMTELGDILMLPKSNITPLIDLLNRINYISRISDNNDRRIIYIDITEKGRKFIGKYREQFYSIIREKLKNISITDLKKIEYVIKFLNEKFNYI